MGILKLPVDTTEPHDKSHLFVPCHGSDGRWILPALQTSFPWLSSLTKHISTRWRGGKLRQKMQKWIIAASRQALTSATATLDSCSHYICVTTSAWIENGSIFLGKQTELGLWPPNLFLLVVLEEEWCTSFALLPEMNSEEEKDFVMSFPLLSFIFRTRRVHYAENSLVSFFWGPHLCQFLGVSVNLQCCWHL